MCRPFFEKYEYFNDYEYPFGSDFLKSIFNDNYKKKYSMIGDGIFDLIFYNNKIYYAKLSQGKNMLVNDGKKAFRDADKDIIIEKICNKLQENNIEYTVNGGKFITFKYNDFIFKVEFIKKAVMPQ